MRKKLIDCIWKEYEEELANCGYCTLFTFSALTQTKLIVHLGFGEIASGPAV